MPWKAKFAFRIFELFGVPPQTTGTWASGAGGMTMCAVGSPGQLAHLAKTSFNLINILCFLLSPRPVCPKIWQASIARCEDLHPCIVGGHQNQAISLISLRLHFHICQMGLMIPP